jgi:hypothetical protein
MPEMDRRREKGLPRKYNRSAMENSARLQYKSLRDREKSRRRGNNAKAMKKQ